MGLPRYADGAPIETGDAVLRSDTVPAHIISVFEDPPAVWLEDAEHLGRSFVTSDLWDLKLVERNTANFERAGIDWLGTQANSGDAHAQAALG